MISNIIKAIDNLFLTKGIEHPFGQKTIAFDYVEKVEAEKVEGFEKATWGKNKVVEVKVSHDLENNKFSWGLDIDKKDYLKPTALDKFDWQVIRQFNSTTDKKEKQISPDKFKLVKPYILRPDITYKEIAAVLGYSVSWVQRIAPRVKDAIKLRNAAPIE